jgi:hypothetical protein
MPRTLLATAVCVVGLAAGCGSAKPHRVPGRSTGPAAAAATSGPAMATTGAVGTLGPGGPGPYRATSGSVLFRIRVALVRFFTSKGFSGVTAQCKGVSPTTASCQLVGSNRSNQTSSARLALSVNQTNGLLRITHVG